MDKYDYAGTEKSPQNLGDKYDYPPNNYWSVVGL